MKIYRKQIEFVQLAAYYSRVTQQSRFGYYKQLIGQKWLFSNGKAVSSL